MPARLLLLCLLLRSSWLTVEGGRHSGAATVLHRRGGRAAVAVSAGMAGGVPKPAQRHSPLPTSPIRSKQQVDPEPAWAFYSTVRQLAPCTPDEAASLVA